MLSFCRDYVSHPNKESAVKDFLLKTSPRIVGHQGGVLIDRGQAVLPQIISLAERMDHTTLCIQGPPGAGKTYTAKHMILALVSQGKRVGITSNSHKAIDNLLVGAHGLLAAQGVDCQSIKVQADDDEALQKQGVELCPSAAKLSFAANHLLIGGTAWTFANEVSNTKFDYLFAMLT